MELKRTQTLPNTIKEVIIQDIIKGEIQPRDKILEEKYAKKTGASRASVREAIFILVSEGIATKVENKGTFLNSFTLEEHIDLYHLRFFIENKALEKVSRIADLVPLIEHLEELSAQMRSSLQAIIDKGEGSREEMAYIGLLNYEFHYALVQFSGSRVLIERYPSFFVSLAFIQNELYLHQRTEVYKPLIEHDALIDALRNRDFDQFSTILAEHHQDVLRLLERGAEKVFL